MPMERRTFGRTGLSVSLLGFGGAEIGFQNTDSSVVQKLLNAALDAGLNVIDTAECYGGSEDMIGNAIGHRRKDFLLFTKVGHEHGFGGGEDWSAASIARTIDRSLKRLRTDVLDLVQLHSCDQKKLAQGECIEALELAKKSGKVRYIGYSGDGPAALFAVRSGRFDALQTSVSIADQEAIDLTLAEARAKNMGVIAKRPIANAAWRFATRPDNSYIVEYWRRLGELAYPFATPGQDDTNAASMALRFTAYTPGVHTCIVGTTNPERWMSNATLLSFGPLSVEEYGSIRARWHEVSRGAWGGQV